MADRITLLTRAYDELSLTERAEALILARDAGREAAAGPVEPQELERADPSEYWLHVIAPAEEAGEIDAKLAKSWSSRLRGAKGLHDPRVQAFLFGWNETAIEVLADVRGDHSDSAEVTRTMWLLDGLIPPPQPGDD